MAAVRSAHGRFSDALALGFRALDVYRKTEWKPGEASTLLLIGDIHVRLGQNDESIEYFNRALQAYQQTGASGATDSLYRIGAVHRRAGRHAEAQRCAEQALEIARKAGRREGVAWAFQLLGVIRADLGHRDEALKCFRRSRDIYEECGVLDGVSRSTGNIGMTLADQGKPEEGLEYSKRALELARRMGLQDLVLMYAFSTGVLLSHDLNRHADAVPYFEEAVTALEAQLAAARGLTDETQATYIGKLRRDQDPYAALGALQLRLGDAGAALQTVERGRARGVLDLLARSRFDPLAEAERRAKVRGDQEQVTALAKVREDLMAADREIRACTYALSQKQTPDSRSGISRRLEKARAARGEVLGRRAHLIRNLVPIAVPASLATIQAALKPNERMLYYGVYDKKTLLFIVPPAGSTVQSHVLPSRAELEPAVRRHLDGIAQAGGAARSLDAPSAKTAATRDADRQLLAKLLPDAALKQLVALKRIYLVPDEFLHRLPFEALPGIDLPPIVYCPSASVLLWCRERRSGQPVARQKYQVVALGDPIFARDRGEIVPPPEGVLVVGGKGLLEAGDVITAYDGRAVGDAKAMRTELRRVEDEVEKAGSRDVRLKVWRAGNQIEITVKPGALGVDVAREPPREAWKNLRSESTITLQRGADDFGELKALPGTRREVESIREALGENAVKLLLGEEATKANLFAAAPMGSYLHLATHQLVDETERRGYSRLALTRPRIATPKDDGFLSLFELLDSWRDRLSSCELVVLSACETLKGPMQKDEGPYAMPLGFLYAGAPAVIGSLWRVDDASTAELFTDFYKRLAKGTPKLQAFTEARKALKKKYPSPYHWAAFVYIGDPR